VLAVTTPGEGASSVTGICAIVLAAGEASRFGAPKQVMLLPEVLRRLASATVDEIVVVAGAHTLAGVRGPQAPGPPVHVADCPDWELGPGRSLRCGMSALGPHCEAAIVVLADGPDLAPASIERIVDDWRAHGGDIVAASYAGARGHPLLVARAVWDDVPDEGLRGRTARLVPCDDLGAPGDVDTPDDLPERLR
jgi:CTP:molybdopterin cytidylyltransferase MocA